MGKIADTLREAKALIADEKNWCQGNLAYDKRGRVVLPQSLSACQFCSLGALHKAVAMQPGLFDDEGYTPSIMPLIKKLRLGMLNLGLGNMPSTISSFNDTHTHPEVMQMFDRAIALAEKEELAQ